MTIKLSNLLQDLVPVSLEQDKELTGITRDSRLVKPGYLFIATEGYDLDGRQYINHAIANGAAAVLQEADQVEFALIEMCPIISIPKLKDNVGALAARFYHYPSQSLKVVGITGTNGKTSCSHFIAAALQGLNIPCGIIGTLGNGFYGALEETQLTTPDIISLQAIFRQFVDQGAKAVAMEVSSHGIDQGRIQAIPFNIAVFTNLSRDHLDYHGTLEAYAAVKKRFLVSPLTEKVVINADDSLGLTCIQELADRKPVFAYSLKPLTNLPKQVSLIYVDDIAYQEQGIEATVHTPWGSGKLSVPLIGQFNLSNALAVLTTLCVLDVPLPRALLQLSKLQSVPGRMQLLGGGDQPMVVVDYSHTPDALEKVLQTLQAHCKGKLFCLFGCGGDRDKGKRPQMAKIAEKWAHQVIVTNDNPRNESPESIVADILTGFSDPKRVLVQLDRAKAIKDVISLASADDWVLIAGKGAEAYQQIGNEKLPFMDAKQVAQCLVECNRIL